MKKLAFVILILFLGGQSFAQVPTFENVDYVGDGHPRHLLDVYIPPGAAKANKTVVFIHGGGWLKGSKKGIMNHCRELYEAGYVVAGIN